VNPGISVKSYEVLKLVYVSFIYDPVIAVSITSLLAVLKCMAVLSFSDVH